MTEVYKVQHKERNTENHRAQRTWGVHITHRAAHVSDLDEISIPQHCGNLDDRKAF